MRNQGVEDYFELYVVEDELSDEEFSDEG